MPLVLIARVQMKVVNLNKNQMIGTINHDSKIDYLELNPGGTKLLFRDKRKQLYLFNIKE